MKTSATGEQFIEITFDEKTKKNQGDSLSAASNSLHNDHHVITEIKDSILCPVSSFKMYLDLLNPDCTTFFQYPNKRKDGFTKEVIGKNPLGTMMKEISDVAGLSKIYTNHQIRKTPVTGMHRSGFSLQEIANVTKHKNLDSLKHYVSKPTLQEKASYNQGLFNYGNTKENPKRSNNKTEPQPKKKQAQNKENLQEERDNDNAIAVQDLQVEPHQQEVRADLRSVITNQLRQAPNLFQNATFSNCNFNFTLPHRTIFVPTYC